MRILSVIIIALFPVIISSCRERTSEQIFPVSEGRDTTMSVSDTANCLYGIPVDSFTLLSGSIKRNGFLSSILLEHGIKMEEIDRLIRNSSDVFDVRKIRYGNHYTLFCSRDSSERAAYMVYEHDPTTSYIFSFKDSLNITPFNKDIESTICYTSATIETSLWDAMMKDGMQPSLVVKLSEIFAWSIDFFGLQKGDSFKVIYEELSIDDKPLDVGRIYGAQFTGSGSTISAIPFIQDSTESYFDEEGKSLRKAFLKAPLQFSRVSSRFSGSRMHPILRIRRPHFGVDYAAPVGTPVHAIGDGRVTKAGTESGAGRVVRIVHNSVYSTAYLHLSRFGQGITSGTYVKQGDIIGYVGSSGLSTGSHLDFRVYMNGSPVDPLKIEAPPVEPVSPENEEDFSKVKKVITSLLGTI